MSLRNLQINAPFAEGVKWLAEQPLQLIWDLVFVVVRDVPASVCSQCGADWINDSLHRNWKKSL